MDKETESNSGVFGRIRARGEEMFTQLSGELMKNEHFLRAVQGAMRGKEKLDAAVARTLKTMNIPTRTEFKRAVGRIEQLEKEIAALREAAARAARGKPKGRAATSRPKAKARAAAGR
jgi:hypothetical protein